MLSAKESFRSLITEKTRDIIEKLVSNMDETNWVQSDEAFESRA